MIKINGPEAKEVSKVRKYLLLFLIVAVFCAFYGCSSSRRASPTRALPRYYAAEALGLGYVKRVAVLPFENHTDTKYAEERFRDVISTEILSRGLFELVEKGETERFLREEVVRKEQETLDQATAQRLGQELGVEAYLAGAVEDFSEKQNGSYSYSVISATLRLVDVKTGQIIWQASDSVSGYRTVDRLFGFASKDANKISFRLAERLLKTLQGD